MSKRPAEDDAGRGHSQQIRRNPEFLDNIYVTVTSPSGKTFSDVLGMFVSSEGRESVIRLSSDYDYGIFRQKLYEELQIPVEDTLYSSEKRILPINTAVDFRVALSQIQSGVVALAQHSQTGLSFLDIHAEAEPEYTPTQSRSKVSLSKAESAAADLLGERGESNHAEAPAHNASGQHSADSAFIIDLTQDDEQQHRGEGSEALVDLDKNSEREIWKFACAFSGHDPTHTDASNPGHCHSFQGLDIAVKPHQLWAVTRILFMYHFEKTFGILLADGMGVGKTLEGTCGIILTPHIRLAAQEVRRDRQARTGRHLVAGTRDHPQSPDSECPSGTYLRGFACPCIDRLPTAQLIESHTLARGPAVILVPPALREQWWEQLSKYVSQEPLSDGVRKTEIWSVHTAADKVSSAMKNKYNRIRFVAASELQSDDITDDLWEWGQDVNDRQRPLLKLGGRKRQDNDHVIMIMPASTALTGIQKESILNVEFEGGDRTEPFFIKPGWVVMDEAHNHITINTVVWQFVTQKLINRSASPLYFVSISGTPIRRSPSALEPFFSIVTSASVRRWKERPGYNPVADFDKWAKESDWLVDRRGNADSTDDARRAEYEQRFRDCKELGRKVLSSYTIQRHSHYDFFGHPIIPLPPMEVESIALPDFPAAHLEDIRSLANLSREQFNKRLENKIASWQNSNPATRGARPTMESIISEMDRGFGAQGRFYELGLCATFPGLAPMLLRGKPCRFRVDDMKGNLNAMSDGDLRNHMLWPYLDEIRNGSKKMDFIQRKIREMLEDKERHKDVKDDRLILRKKMIIFALSPAIAFLIAFILRKELPHVRQTLVLATDAPAKRGSLYAPFCRMTDEEVAEDRDPDDPLLLITTARIAAEGWNMTRPNHVILTEPAFAKQVEEQAFRRVHRHGQQASTHLFSVYSSWNPAEMIIRSRRDARSRLLDESIWTVTGA